MPLSEVNNAFYELVDANWSPMERQVLHMQAENAMDSDSFSKGYQHLDRVYNQDDEGEFGQWDYPDPPHYES